MGASIDISQAGLSKRGTPNYAAFISYAHSDEARAAALHRLLERYRPPADLKDRRHLLRPVFRDKEELTASHSLTDKIQAAVEGSRKLIVLCSPAAKASKWVNAEIRLFRDLHGEDAILCALLEGTPETSFPAALTEGGREPLAADLTGDYRAGRAESFRYGMLQLAASMLGVGLDALVRRDAKRRRRIGSAVLLGALGFSGAMGLSTYNAVQSQKLAEANRAEAEDLVEYMITDLKTNLEPVGRLDILDGVGAKVMEYYSGQEMSEMPDDRLARQARAQHILGEVALDAGKYEDAKTQLDAAYALTKEVLSRNPDDTDAIFAHAQSAYWVGKVFRVQKMNEQVRPHWQEYFDLSYSLYNHDKNNLDWVMELAWGENNLGIVERLTGNSLKAFQHYSRSIALLDDALKISPNSVSILFEKSNTVTGAEQLALAAGNYKEALSLNRTALQTLLEIRDIKPNSMSIRFEALKQQSNLFWQYAPLLTRSERRQLIVDPIKGFNALTQHDPENKNWHTSYIWHLYHGLRYSDSVEIEQTLFQSANEYIMREVRPAFTLNQAFLLEAINARSKWSQGQETEAILIMQQLDRMQKEASESSSIKIEKSRLQAYNHQIAENYSQFGLNDAEKYADLYLTSIENRGSIVRFDALLRKATMEVLIGECQVAQVTVTPILKLNMNSDEYPLQLKKIISCSA